MSNGEGEGQAEFRGAPIEKWTWLHENGWSATIELFQHARPLFCMLAAGISTAMAAAVDMGIEFLEIKHNRRGMERLNQTILALNTELYRLKERISEIDADTYVELRELGRKCFDEPYNRKLNYFIELMSEKLSDDQALAKDKYYRFKRWVEQLDIVCLRALTRFRESSVHLQAQQNPNDNASRVYISGGARLGLPLVTKSDYLEILTGEERMSNWELISQCEAVGMLMFDRGGGAATPGAGARCVWHRDTGKFAEFLRKTAERRGEPKYEDEVE